MLEKTEDARIDAAKAGDEAAFGALIEPLNRELLAYAYRMLGGFHDAEDALQDARLKAWRALVSYESRATFRAWMYRIVTNTCLDLLRTRKRRVLPQELGPPTEPGPPSADVRNDIPWIEPYPDALLPPATNPEAAILLQESVRLALIRALQVLPPRQRAALILHDVLDWSVSEVAAILETTPAAINSALQRARARVSTGDEGSRAKHDEALEKFIAAWETGNFDAFVSMLAEDAIMSMPPWPYWLQGRDALASTFLHPLTWDGAPREGRYRSLVTPMNGQPAALAYVRMDDGRYVAMCMTVLTIADDRISELTVFVLPEHFRAWGYPATLE